MTYQTRRPGPIQRVWHGLSRLGRTASGGGSAAFTRRRVLVSVVATLTALLGGGVVTAQPAAAAVTYYYIANNNTGLWLDNWDASWSGAPIGEEWFAGRGPSSRWGLEYQGMGYYKVINSVSNMCMTANGFNPPNGSVVVQSTCRSVAGQSWLLSNIRGNGVFEFRLGNSGPCLDIEPPFLRGSDAVVNACNGWGSQGWTLEKA
jgi:hypothetical protein